jgi:hypothetical protein
MTINTATIVYAAKAGQNATYVSPWNSQQLGNNIIILKDSYNHRIAAVIESKRGFVVDIPKSATRVL